MQIWDGKSAFDWKSIRKKMCCAADNHNYMCHVCAKEYFDLNFNDAVIDKISNSHKIALNFTYS